MHASSKPQHDFEEALKNSRSLTAKQKHRLRQTRFTRWRMQQRRKVLQFKNLLSTVSPYVQHLIHELEKPPKKTFPKDKTEAMLEEFFFSSNLKKQKKVRNLIKDLFSPNRLEVMNALETLGQLTFKDALPVMRCFLYHPSFEVRLAALRSFLWFKSSSLVPWIEPLKKDPSVKVRESAAEIAEALKAFKA